MDALPVSRAEAPEDRTGGAMAAEFRSLARLAGPIIIGQLAVIGSAVIDNILAGHLGAIVLGAVAVGSGLWVFALMPVIGVMMAVSPIVAELDGAGRRSEAAGVFRTAVVLGVLLGAVSALVLAFAGPALLGLIGVAPSIRPGAAAFLRDVAFGLPVVGAFAAARGLSEGLSRTAPTMVIQLGGLALLAPSGYALMYGAWGLPALGAAGSGLATAAVATLQGLAYVVWVRRSPAYRLDWSMPGRGPDRATAVRILALGVPIAVSLAMEVGMFTAAGLIVSRLGAVATAASQIALNVSSVLFMIPLGIALAVTIRVGRASGQGDPAAVRRAILAGATLAAGVVLADDAILLVARRSLAALYTGDAAVVGLASFLLLIAAANHVPDGVQVLAGGVLRGLRDTRMPMLLTTVSYWGIGVPVTALLALRTPLGAAGAWIGMSVGVGVAAVLLGRRVVQSLRTT